MQEWYRLDVSSAIERLGSDWNQGLPEPVWRERQAQYGPNELQDTGGRKAWMILWEQFTGTMVVILIIAAIISAFLNEYTDAIVILAIVMLNAALGFFQDYRAEKALAALKRLAVPRVRVRRDGALREIDSRDLVPGDIIVIEAGNQIPADCRVIESFNLKCLESALTGESEPVEKRTAALSIPDLPLGDRHNMAYMGTLATYGRGLGLVTATGMDTELGQIARTLQSVDDEATPLQKRLAQLGRSLALVAVGIVSVYFVLGVLLGEPPRLMLMTSLSLAVAVVPEGLPAVATVVLAIGARRMFHRNALIRKLPAVETLGSVTVICSDKTGTLTENRMTVTILDAAGDRVDLTEYLQRGHPRYERSTSDQLDDLRRQVKECPALSLLLAGAGLCNDAELEHDPDRESLVAVGDPTEGALAIAAEELGLRRETLLAVFPRVGEIPFDSDRRRMTTIHAINPPEHAVEGDDPVVALALRLRSIGLSRVAFTKGAVDSILSQCDQVWEGEGARPITDADRLQIDTSNVELASRGMRVLGVSMKALDEENSSSDEDAAERSMTYVGLLAMIDPPRPEVARAVATCLEAGIRPIMITGDHPLTAQHIASRLGIGTTSRVLTGQELERVSRAELGEILREVSVFARVAPRHKLELVRALQDKGQVVAMTGDGVNDAPALKQAHIGVAMGITGTDVSKEAAQMVLLDDNFATIVNAVEEGRIVYDNIRKFIKYTLTSNAGEIWVMVLGPLMGMPLPLLPLQILWVNLVTDGLPGLALAVEPAERDTMKRPPFPPREHVLGRGMGYDIAWIGLLMGVVALALGYWNWAYDSTTEPYWRTIIFTVLTLAQMGNALAIRSSSESLFHLGLFSNRPLLASVLLTFALQMAVIYWSPLQRLFHTVPLTAADLLACLLLSSIVFWAVEASKWIARRRTRTGTIEVPSRDEPRAAGVSTLAGDEARTGS